MLHIVAGSCTQSPRSSFPGRPKYDHFPMVLLTPPFAWSNFPSMTPKPNEKPPQAPLPRTTTSPTQPGAYWYQPVGLLTAKLLEVRLTNGELTVWWADRDIAIVKLRGYWLGPILPSTGPVRR